MAPPLVYIHPTRTPANTAPQITVNPVNPAPIPVNPPNPAPAANQRNQRNQPPAPAANPATQAPAPQPPAPTNPAPQPPCNPGPRKMTSDDWWRLAKSVAASVGTFWISYFILIAFAPTWSFWVIVMLSFIAASLILAAIDAATNTRSGLGSSILLFILLQAGFLLAYHYGKAAKDQPPENKTEIVETEPVVSPRYMEYNDNGVFILDLNQGQTSGWIKVGDCHRYNFSHGNIILEYEDGSRVNISKLQSLPNQSIFKVTNLDETQVRLLIKPPY